MLHKLTDATRGLWPARARRLPSSRKRRLLGTGRIEQHGGLTALYVSGTPYEMGYQQGALARGLIHAYRQAAYDYVLPQVPGPKRLAKPALFHYASAYWPTIPAELQQEMKGIADGAGAHPIEVLVSAAIWEIVLVSGCSEFAATGPVTADGSLLHGYNYDLMHPEHALIQPYLAALFFRPARGVPFFTVNTVGSVGANAGMNEAGISVAWDNTYLRQEEELTRGISLPVVPFVITLRRLLQFAHTLDEAMGIVTGSLPRPLADIVIIGSAQEGRAVALETAGHKFAVREMDGGAIWSTNCFRSAELAAYDRRGDGRGLDEALAWQRFPRYLAYRDLFAASHGWLDADLATSFLRDPYPREKDGYRLPVPLPRATICRDITSFSLVMEPGKGRLWVSDTDLPACQGSFYAFSLTAGGRLPELDVAPTGYTAALRAARCFAQGDRVGTRTALAEAAARDGASAPLLLMTAVLEAMEGQEARATALLQEVAARFAWTPAERLATVWLGAGGDADAPSIPFPSAIRPAIRLQTGATWEERAVVTST